jgi:L-fuconolactonase
MEPFRALTLVTCNLASMVIEVDRRTWAPDDLRPDVHRALDLFDLDRVMFGADWPVSRRGTTGSDGVDIQAR